MSTAIVKETGVVVEYIPLGESQSIKLTPNIVRTYVSQPTKQGNSASDQDCMVFMMLCRARELNPFTGDAYLLGYDTKDGPKFSLITAAQALFKRAERSGAFNGIESGVIVKTKEGEIIDREGDFMLNGDVVAGAWARVYRKDCAIPFTDRLNFDVYNTNQSRWAKDPAGMIVKCTEASALRKAFPSQLGGMMTREEMEHVVDNSRTIVQQPKRGLNKAPILAIEHDTAPPMDFTPGEQERETVPVERTQEQPKQQAAAVDCSHMFAHCDSLVTLEKTKAEYLNDDPTLTLTDGFESAYKQRKIELKK